MNKINIHTGNCLDILPTMAEGSVNCCVTSPPYFGLRDYGNDEQIGLEETPEAFVESMVNVFREVKRVLADDGTLWLNLGDSYWNNFGGGSGTCTTGNADALKTVGRRNKPKSNLWKIKDLCGVPWAVANALREPTFQCAYCKKSKRYSQWAKWDNGSFMMCSSCGQRCKKQPEKDSDGWYLRQDIIWSKPNPMPESVTDRCTKAHEYIFLLSKKPKYYYDADAIKESASESTNDRGRYARTGNPKETRDGYINHLDPNGGTHRDCGGLRNKRSVWEVTTQPYSGAHFATFPPDLIKPCIMAGCPAGGTVLDPFGGSGTTGMVALELGRSAELIELNPDYVEIIKERTDVTLGFVF